MTDDERDEALGRRMAEAASPAEMGRAIREAINAEIDRRNAELLEKLERA